MLEYFYKESKNDFLKFFYSKNYHKNIFKIVM